MNHGTFSAFKSLPQVIATTVMTVLYNRMLRMPPGVLGALAPICSRITAIMNTQQQQQQQQHDANDSDTEQRDQQQQQQQHGANNSNTEQRDQQQMLTAERVQLMQLAAALLGLAHGLVNIWPGPALLSAAMAPVVALLAPLAVAVLQEAKALLAAPAGSMTKQLAETCGETAAKAAGTGITAQALITQMVTSPDTAANTACVTKFAASEEVLLLLLVNVAGTACLEHQQARGSTSTSAAASSITASTTNDNTHSSSSSSSSNSAAANHQQLLQEFGLQEQYMGLQQRWWHTIADPAHASVRTLHFGLAATTERSSSGQALPIARHLVLPLVLLLADLTAASSSPQLMCEALEAMNACLHLLGDTATSSYTIGGLYNSLGLGAPRLQESAAAAALQAVLSCAPAVQRLLLQPPDRSSPEDVGTRTRIIRALSSLISTAGRQGALSSKWEVVEQACSCC
jgi:hypothetical protein